MCHRPLLLVWFTCSALAAQDFERDVAPILLRRCLDCHSGLEPKGKLDLSNPKGAARAIEAGHPDDSALWLRVADDEMPPKKPLAKAEKDVLKAWIKAGAKWGKGPLDLLEHTTDVRAGSDWWSLRPVQRPPSPKVKNSTWALNPIDRFILVKLESHGLAPSAAAERRTLLRRVKFDLVGLPPTPEETETFLNDARPDAYERLVDRLLASPAYGERWARHWLDVVRFGESHGFEFDELRKNAWHYRDWVIQALNRDMPYDEFVTMQLAGDARYPGEPRGVIPTGFLVAGGFDTVGQKQQSAAQRAIVRQDELEDMIGAVGQTFLGLTIHCARCHDHKFDPIRQTDYYRLAAALAGVQHGEREWKDADLETRRSQKLKQLGDILKEIERIEAPVRAAILAQRQNGSVGDLPRPMARWDFTKSMNDEIGTLHAALKGDAQQNAEGLVLTGTTGYAMTAKLKTTLAARTFAVRVQLANLKQRGGAALSLQRLDGTQFDAVVFGEREPGRWLAGSENFARSTPFAGPAETETQPIHLVYVYRDDGTILAYRNGKSYGNAIKSSGPTSFLAEQSQLLFGLRHSPIGSNRHLLGRILQAEVYDRPLSAEEAAAISGDASGFVSENALVARLTPEAKAARQRKLEQAADLRKTLAENVRPKAYAVRSTAPEATHVLLRGETTRKGAEIGPAGVQAITGQKESKPSQADDLQRRLELARWIASPGNPLLGRVMVNRLWHHHFGVGLVDTPSDFGFSGGRPSHPELLDWLADEFRQSGWSMKHLHRLMVTSATYRQQSGFRPDAAKLDAGNRLLWRKSPMRLEAEATRDAVLAVAGKLKLEAGGPGFHDFTFTIRGATHFYVAKETLEPDAMRRSIYRTWVRGGRNPLLDTLDCPDPSTVTPRRAVTTTPLQALSLLNSQFMLAMTDALAERVAKDAGPSRAAQIERVYQLTLGRAPRPEEISVAQHVSLAVLCRALLNTNEFMYVD